MFKPWTEVSDGVIFVFGDGREAVKTAPPPSRPVPVATDSPVSPPVSAVTEVVDRPAPAPPARVAAVVQQQAVVAALQEAPQQQQKQQQALEAHPLLAIVAFAELLIDAINPTAGQTRKMKRSSMPKDDTSSMPSTYVAPTGVLGRASLPGAVLGLVFTAVSGVVRQVAAQASK